MGEGGELSELRFCSVSVFLISWNKQFLIVGKVAILEH